MLKVENTDIYGWEAAIRGCRNPYNSWEKSDTVACFGECIDCTSEYADYPIDCPCMDDSLLTHAIGSNDLKLMKTLAKAGNDHAKFLRMINVTCDITAPLYFFKEYDTYKVATVANSCSTMHTIHKKEFTLDDFSHEHLGGQPLEALKFTVLVLNNAREYYLQTKDKSDWWQMIQLLPSSYNQKRTVQLNYQVLKSMYFARKDHRLDEWHTLCEWMEFLPYFKEICLD